MSERIRRVQDQARPLDPILAEADFFRPEGRNPKIVVRAPKIVERVFGHTENESEPGFIKEFGGRIKLFRNRATGEVRAILANIKPLGLSASFDDRLVKGTEDLTRVRDVAPLIAARQGLLEQIVIAERVLEFADDPRFPNYSLSELKRLKLNARLGFLHTALLVNGALTHWDMSQLELSPAGGDPGLLADQKSWYDRVVEGAARFGPMLSVSPPRSTTTEGPGDHTYQIEPKTKGSVANRQGTSDADSTTETSFWASPAGTVTKVAVVAGSGVSAVALACQMGLINPDSGVALDPTEWEEVEPTGTTPPIKTETVTVLPSGTPSEVPVTETPTIEPTKSLVETFSTMGAITEELRINGMGIFETVPVVTMGSFDQGVGLLSQLPENITEDQLRVFITEQRTDMFGTISHLYDRGNRSFIIPENMNGDYLDILQNNFPQAEFIVRHDVNVPWENQTGRVLLDMRANQFGFSWAVSELASDGSIRRLWAVNPNTGLRTPYSAQIQDNEVVYQQVPASEQFGSSVFLRTPIGDILARVDAQGNVLSVLGMNANFSESVTIWEPLVEVTDAQILSGLGYDTESLGQVEHVVYNSSGQEMLTTPERGVVAYRKSDGSWVSTEGWAEKMSNSSNVVDIVTVSPGGEDIRWLWGVMDGEVILEQIPLTDNDGDLLGTNIMAIRLFTLDNSNRTHMLLVPLLIEDVNGNVIDLDSLNANWPGKSLEDLIELRMRLITRGKPVPIAFANDLVHAQAMSVQHSPEGIESWFSILSDWVDALDVPVQDALFSGENIPQIIIPVNAANSAFFARTNVGLPSEVVFTP